MQPNTSATRILPRVAQRFNPYKRFRGTFTPDPIRLYPHLSRGAKATYARLLRYAGKNGQAYPSMDTLARELLVSSAQARRYVNELEREGFIAIDRTNRRYRSNGSGGANQYYFIEHPVFAGGLAAQTSPPPLADLSGVPLAKMQALTPCKNASQRESSSNEEESQEKERRPLRANRKERNAHPAPYALSESSTVLAAHDDDENPLARKPPVRERASNPRAEFRMLVREWHGPDMDITGPEEQITRMLDKAGLEWTWDFIEHIRKRTTNPTSLTLNPAGHYVKLAGQFVTHQKTAVMEAAMQQHRAIQALAQQSPEKTERCPKCQAGYLASPPQSPDDYCDCQLGRELKRVESKSATDDSEISRRFARLLGRGA